MKIYTAKYKAEQPATKELHVPTDSKYGIGLQFERDGQPWDLKQSEVTLGGLSADDVVDGTFIFKRTSGEHGQKVSDVRAADMGVHVGSSEVLSGDNRNRISPMYGQLHLSNLISEPVEISYDQFMVYIRVSLSGDFADVMESMYGQYLFIAEVSSNKDPFARPLPNERKFVYFPEGSYDVSAQALSVVTDTITLQPGGLIQAQHGNGKGQWLRELSVTIDTADTIRNYKLAETAEDKGVVLGFNEKYVLKDSIELSGSYDDDTTFDCTLPITD